MTIEALLWNVKGWRGKGEELARRMQEYNVRIITETKHKREDHLHIPGYDVITENKYNNENGGAEGKAVIIIEG